MAFISIGGLGSWCEFRVQIVALSAPPGRITRFKCQTGRSLDIAWKLVRHFLMYIVYNPCSA